jgi:hypothetical protein
MEESKKLQEAYTIYYTSCIESLICLSYTIPYIAFAVNKLEKINTQQGEPHIKLIVHLLRYIRDHSQSGLKLYSNEKKAQVVHIL